MIARRARRDATFTSAANPVRASSARWVVGVLGVLGAAATGCGNSAPHGPPQLQQIYWETRGGVQTLAWTAIPADAEVAPTVSPAATQFDLVLDRVIDGSKIENTSTTNGVSIQRPKPTGDPSVLMGDAGVLLGDADASTGDAGALAADQSPVLVTWLDIATSIAKLQAEMPAQNFSLSVWYNSLHLPIAPANTAYIYGRALPSYPSNTAITICIDPKGVTSQYGEPMQPIPPGLSSECSIKSASGTPLTAITITTKPFSVEINPPPAGTTAPADGATPTYVPTNFQIPLQFNNIPVDLTNFATQLPQYLQVRQGGTLLSVGQYQLQAAPSDPTLIMLQPGSIEIWDSGAELDVTLSADLPDIYGATLGAAQSAAFIPCQLASQDGGTRICAPSTHPGTDGGASDASDASTVVDAGTTVDSGDDASDAPVDAGADAATD